MMAASECAFTDVIDVLFDSRMSLASYPRLTVISALGNSGILGSL